MPTPAVAYLTRSLRANAGIVISASHNPHQDNGIKFFSAAGEKLDDSVELAIERELEATFTTADSEAIGRVVRIEDAAARYAEFCKSTVPTALSLRGFSIVLDCAHGATYQIAPKVFAELGAKVEAIGNRPDGLNINRGFGSTTPQALMRAVLDAGADSGSHSTATAIACRWSIAKAGSSTAMNCFTCSRTTGTRRDACAARSSARS